MEKNIGFDPKFDYKFNPKTATEAVKWFKEKITTLTGNDAPKNRLSQTQILESLPQMDRFESGKMYLFNYDPIGRKTLPYYDTFPLILLTDIKKDGFYGINLHYLPVEKRMVLLSNIVPKKGIYLNNELQKIYIKYDSLKGVQEFQLFEPCFKKYLKSRVRSVIKLVPTEDWGYAAALPIEAFKKKIKQEVWKQSMATQNMTL